MPDADVSDADLALFVDLDAAARSVGVAPCLIGAGAIRLGADLAWRVRLSRVTLDWDFAVRVDAWRTFDGLTAELTTTAGGFARGKAPHRFRHRSGGTLDVIPYGALEHPPGTLRWRDETVMETLGFDALDEHRCTTALDGVEVSAASLPAVIGLKLLAYRSRSPGITRDIVDVHDALVQVDALDATSRIDERTIERLGDEHVRFDGLGSYFLGRELGRTFVDEARGRIIEILRAAGNPEGRAVADALRPVGNPEPRRQDAARRFDALRIGIEDA